MNLRTVMRVVLGINLLLLGLIPTHSAVIYAEDEMTIEDEILAIESITKLSGAMVAGGEVNSYEISPNGQYAVFRADKDTDEKMELYSVNLQTKAVVKLNHVLAADEDVSNIYISPDSQWVVFKMLRNSTAYALYSVPIGGGTPKTITHPTLAADRSPRDFTITSDSQYVVFICDQDTNDKNELYRSPISGTQIGNPSTYPTKLNSDIASDADIFTFVVAPNSGYVVYSLLTGGYTRSIWQVAITGGTNTKISTDETDYSIFGFWITPNSNRVIYKLGTLSNATHRLMSVAPTGGTAIRLDNPSLTEGTIDQVRITNNSAFVVFTGALNDASKLDLYSAPTAGPATSMKKLTGTLVTGGNVDCGIDNSYYDFQITPDSATVVYCADALVDGRFEIYKTATNGLSVLNRLSQIAVSGKSGAYSFTITPDSSRVLYTGNFNDTPYSQAFSVGLPLQTPVLMAEFSSAIERYVIWIYPSPDSTKAILNIGTSTAATEGYRLYQSPSRGGLALNITDTITNTWHTYFSNLNWLPNSQKIVVISDLGADGVDELFLMDANLAATFLPMTVRP